MSVWQQNSPCDVETIKCGYIPLAHYYLTVDVDWYIYFIS